MEIIQNKYTLTDITYSLDKYFDEDTLLFDIECTGLSPRKSFIYLIGYGTRNGNEIEINQLLANDETEESEILLYFENVLKSFPKIMGFNSSRFDQSFICERCKLYGINTEIKSKYHLDIYLTATKAKCLLDLQNYKQKTLEVFLGLKREDKYDGGQLIPVYKEYSKTRDKSLKDLFLLHNYEDVKGMVSLIDILAYCDILTCDLTLSDTEVSQDRYRSYWTLPYSIPSPINKQRPYGTYVIKDNTISLALNITSNSLYTFLPDNKNYYYLLNEDIIIPKSLGASVDPSNRRPASKSDCKVKKDGDFIQIPNHVDVGNKARTFRKDYSDDENFLSIEDIDPGQIKKILTYMLKH
ncbi:MAG: ribonuclease H-like domain-containing protein [Pseudobutyrivibrio sp.]|nr:ribonuclease H-like domain-containing protein [Pseudobutyrivibrio sp.]